VKALLLELSLLRWPLLSPRACTPWRWHWLRKQRLGEVRNGAASAGVSGGSPKVGNGFERLSLRGGFLGWRRYSPRSAGKTKIPPERAADLSGSFGGLVWFLAIFGGADRDASGRFRPRPWRLAYLICGLLFSSSALARSAVAGSAANACLPFGGGVVTFVLMLLRWGGDGQSQASSETTGASVETKKLCASIGYSI